MKSFPRWFPFVGILLVVMALTATASAAPIIVTVAPEGDGNSFKARYGYSDTWNDYDFQSDANPVQAHHSYSSGWGEIKIAYLQISLEDIPAGFDVTSSELNLHITNVGGSGATLKHRSDSASATGHANQELSGDVDVTVLDTGIGTGWHRIDVTDYIRSDLSKNHSWAVFSMPSSSYSDVSFSGSSETGSEPYLSVVPEPATGLMVLLAALGLGLSRHWRRR